MDRLFLINLTSFNIFYNPIHRMTTSTTTTTTTTTMIIGVVIAVLKCGVYTGYDLKDLDLVQATVFQAVAT